MWVLIGQWEWSLGQPFYLWYRVQHGRGRGKSSHCLAWWSLLHRWVMPSCLLHTLPTHAQRWSCRFGGHHCEWKLLPAKWKMLQTPSHWSLPHGEPWGDSRRERIGYWSQVAEVHIRGRISVNPHSCIFLYKDMSSTWDIWFSLINSNLWVIPLSGHVAKLLHLFP